MSNNNPDIHTPNVVELWQGCKKVGAGYGFHFIAPNIVVIEYARMDPDAEPDGVSVVDFDCLETYVDFKLIYSNSDTNSRLGTTTAGQPLQWSEMPEEVAFFEPPKPIYTDDVITVKQLKEFLTHIPDTNPETGEDTEVWIMDDKNLSSRCRTLVCLNTTDYSADILLSRTND